MLPALYYPDGISVEEFYNYYKDSHWHWYEIKNIAKLFCEQHYKLYCPSFSTDEWHHILSAMYYHKLDDYKKYHQGYYVGKHGLVGGSAYNYEMYKVLLLDFPYMDGYTEEDVNRMLSNLEAARQKATYVINDRTYDASFNSCPSNKIKNICLDYIQVRSRIINNKALAPQEKCYKMLELCSKYIYEYEKEAVDLLTGMLYFRAFD